ncbi:transcription factor IIIB 50 kDa subunit isoform X1 [Etheostoma cragini]|uniref:transcription factor IIIB 50 kDa subunit isoform X1 n=1 Tax=Etheostoma cragini TaxID=417921 RepID=UPI00155ED3F9|nr:transcription factor IIIB 50 kDa subunit isoform X1 [Etheostoma cragini]XP_034751824.1 transcription factor IIIB 50 kDa subunit isoform X1 [Etheostoma cragini]
MSRASLSCPGCGSSNIVDDNLYCQSQLVCVDCGSVVSEGALVAGDDYAGGSDVSYSRSTAVAKKPCMNLIKGIQRVKAICRILRVNSEIEDLSQTYYNQAYQHESFIRVSLQKKEVLAGCCVLVCCRLLNWPITMGTISCLLDADPMAVGMVYQEMVKILKIEPPIINVTEVMEAHSLEYKISSLQVPEQYAENSKDLSKRAVALVELAADSWIVTGRRPIPIMMAAIYLSWQSLKPNKHRLKCSLEKFCQIAKVNKHRPASKRITEMKKVLCKLGKEIPWVRDAVTPDNVVRQVEDILTHRYALLRRALRTHEEALVAECQASSEDSVTEETTPTQISELVEKNPNASPLEQCELKAERALRPEDGDDNPCTLPELHTGIQESQHPTPNWGKSVLFAPPCVTHPRKRRRVEQPELKDVTGDEEISDSEIDSYIRTPREAREFSLTQQLIQESQKS